MLLRGSHPHSPDSALRRQLASLILSLHNAIEYLDTQLLQASSNGGFADSWNEYEEKLRDTIDTFQASVRSVVDEALASGATLSEKLDAAIGNLIGDAEWSLGKLQEAMRRGDKRFAVSLAVAIRAGNRCRLLDFQQVADDASVDMEQFGGSKNLAMPGARVNASSTHGMRAISEDVSVNDPFLNPPLEPAISPSQPLQNGSDHGGNKLVKSLKKLLWFTGPRRSKQEREAQKRASIMNDDCNNAPVGSRRAVQNAGSRNTVHFGTTPFIYDDAPVYPHGNAPRSKTCTNLTNDAKSPMLDQRRPSHPTLALHANATAQNRAMTQQVSLRNAVSPAAARAAARLHGHRAVSSYSPVASVAALHAPPSNRGSTYSEPGHQEPHHPSTSHSNSSTDDIFTVPAIIPATLTRSRTRDARPYTVYGNEIIQVDPHLMLSGDQQRCHPWAGRQCLPIPPHPLYSDLRDRHSNILMRDFQTIVHVLQHRGINEPKGTAFITVDTKGKETRRVTWEYIWTRTCRVARRLQANTALRKGSKIGLVFRRSEPIEYIIALFGCFLATMVPVPIAHLDSMRELDTTLIFATAQLVLSSQVNLDAMSKLVKENSGRWPAGIPWMKIDSSIELKAGGSDPPSIVSRDVDLAYIEFSKNLAGEIKGVGINHRTIMAHAASLQHLLHGPRHALGGPVDVIATSIDSRSQLGLVVSVLFAVYAGYQVVLLPTIAATVPGLWINMLSRYRATVSLSDYDSLQAITASFTENPQSVLGFDLKSPPDLATLRHLLVDTQLPDERLNWLIATNLLANLGCLHHRDAIAPLCSLTEHGSMILAFRGFSLGDTVTTGRFDTQSFASDALLKELIVVVDQTFDDDRGGAMRLTSFGPIVPQTTIAVVDPSRKALCPPEVLGEIWVDGPALSGGFWGLTKHTESIFRAHPIQFLPDGSELELPEEFLRTGLIGTIVNGQLYVLGPYENRVKLSIAVGDNACSTGIIYSEYVVRALQVRMPFISDGSVFDILLGTKSRIVVVVETEVVDSLSQSACESICGYFRDIYAVEPYSVLLCARSTLPRTYRNGRLVISGPLVREAFETGRLVTRHAVVYAKMSAQTDEVISPQSATYRPTQLQLSDVLPPSTPARPLDEFKNRCMLDILRNHLEGQPSIPLYAVVNASGHEHAVHSAEMFCRLVVYIAKDLLPKIANFGQKVLVIGSDNVEYPATVYACMLVGALPFVWCPVSTSPESPSEHAIENLCSQIEFDFVVSTDASMHLPKFASESTGEPRSFARMPVAIRYERLAASKAVLTTNPNFFEYDETVVNGPAVVLITVAHRAVQQTVLSHDALFAQCKAISGGLQLLPSRPLLSYGLSNASAHQLLRLFLGVYVGCQTVLAAANRAAPRRVLDLVRKYKVKDVFEDMDMFAASLKGLRKSDFDQVAAKTVRSWNLTHLGRLSVSLNQDIAAAFREGTLEMANISPLLSCTVNPLISWRPYSGSGAQIMTICSSRLRRGVIAMLSEHDRSSGVAIMDSGKCVRGSQIAILNWSTGELCQPAEFGEVYISGGGNASLVDCHPLAEIAGAPQERLIADASFIPTGRLGFLWPDLRNMHREQFLYYLGDKDETFGANGLFHFCNDVEARVQACHPNVADHGCIIVSIAEDVIVVVKPRVATGTVLNAMVPVIVAAIHENHEFVPDQIVFMRPLCPHFTRIKNRGVVYGALVEKSSDIILRHIVR